MRPEFIKAGDKILSIHVINEVDISSIESGEVTITTCSGNVYKAYGFDAIETVMVFKPSALEGRRMRWQRNAWAFHNFIGHPVVQILAWLGFKKQAVRFHDWTTPCPRDFKR